MNRGCPATGGTLTATAGEGQRDGARARFSHPLYRANRRLFAAGYNLNVLGGL